MNDAIKEALNRIIEWTKIKCRIHATPTHRPYFSEREVWWTHLGENVGSEQNGKNGLFERPTLIVKKFNGDLLWVVPLSTTDRTKPYYHPLSLTPEHREVKAILSQLRTISSKRLIRKQRTVLWEDFNAIKKKLVEILE